jgi:hypothetical protein
VDILVNDEKTVSLDDLTDAIEVYYEQGWTDGLPVVPPTRKAVEKMLEGTNRNADDIICRVPPKWGIATVEKVAVNAVMAGCLPSYLPIVITALEALMDDRLNLHGVQCTTHVTTPLVLVNGPIANEVGINSGHNCFGQGWRANATIGRALRLIMVNIGGAKPGVIDKATFGHPGKYTYCFAENEQESPWEPYQTDLGYNANESTVTVFAAEAPHNINNHGENPYTILTAVADTMATLGNNNMYVMGDAFVVLGVDHANIIAEAGWKKHNVQHFLFENARIPIERLRNGGMYGQEIHRNLWPRWIDRANPEALVPVVREPKDIKVVVAGGAGPHSLFIAGWGTRSVTRKIDIS